MDSDAAVALYTRGGGAGRPEGYFRGSGDPSSTPNLPAKAKVVTFNDFSMTFYVTKVLPK